MNVPAFPARQYAKRYAARLYVLFTVTGKVRPDLPDLPEQAWM